MRKSTLIFISMFLISCSNQVKIIQSVSCKKSFELQIDKKDKVLVNKKQNFFTVNFLYGFDEDIDAFVNDELIFEKYVMTKNSSDKIEYYFEYNYSKDVKNPILKIASKKDSTCIDIEIPKKYKMIYLLKDNDKWTVRFSNNYYIN